MVLSVMNWKILTICHPAIDWVADCHAFKTMKISSDSIDPVEFLRWVRSYHMKEAQYNEYDGNHEQGVDPITGFWEVWT